MLPISTSVFVEAGHRESDCDALQGMDVGGSEHTNRKLGVSVG